MKADGSRSTTVTLGGVHTPQHAPIVTAPGRTYNAATDDSADWERYVAAVFRHPWFVLCVVLMGTVAGILATGLLQERYAAHTVLWIEPDNPDGQRTALGPDAIVEPEGWIDLVRSQTVVGPVVRRLRLYVHPSSPPAAAALRDFIATENIREGEYTLTTTAGGGYTLRNDAGHVLEEGAIGDSVGTHLGFEWAPGPEVLPANGSVTFTVVTPFQESLRLAEALDVSLDPGGSFIKVGLKGGNKARVSATLNGVTDRVVVVAADLKREKLEALTTILSERYTEAGQELRDAEARLSAFRVRTVDDAAAGGPPLAGGDDGAIDGRAIGNTPVAGVPVAPGTHQLRIERDGYHPFETIVTVDPGGEVRMTEIVLRSVIS